MARHVRMHGRHAVEFTPEAAPAGARAPEMSPRADTLVSTSDVAQGLGARLTSALGARRGRLCVAAQPTAAQRPDAASVFRVHDASGRPRAVVLCSPPAAPDIVQRGIEHARTAERAMLPTEARHVLRPLATGRLYGLSYAVMPYCIELARDRLAWLLQRRWLAPALLDWLWCVNAATVRAPGADECEARFARALARLAMDMPLSTPVRAAALRAAGRLRSGRWRVKTVLMHGDLWKANILLRPPARLLDAVAPRGRFVVIDWPASSLHGHAIYDLVRLAQSMNLSDRALRREIGRHCAILQCASEDAMSYLLAACGDLASDLQHFSMDRFVPMVESSHATLDHALRIAGE